MSLTQQNQGRGADGFCTLLFILEREERIFITRINNHKVKHWTWGRSRKGSAIDRRQVIQGELACFIFFCFHHKKVKKIVMTDPELVVWFAPEYLIIFCHTSTPGRLHCYQFSPRVRWSAVHRMQTDCTWIFHIVPEYSIWPAVWKNNHQIPDAWKAKKTKV